ncbi:glycoside hydrolase family 31 protein [Algoriphagus confluentis]|uniref:Glycoside hydrolase family 31 protein n=1 Tax=Algoriphagus confluentis TaxID=1697556 RepID=A0ABQ6PPK8_9BACT|nr:glycoside hydrolase family 31 protein [Algoriphagus confluentis]
MSSTLRSLSTSRKSVRSQPFGPVLDWNLENSQLEGRNDQAQFRLTIYQPGIVRVQISRFEQFHSNPYSVVAQPSAPEFSLVEHEHSLEIHTPLLQIKVNLESFQLGFFTTEGTLLNEDDPLSVSWIGSEVTCYKQVQKNEKFVGLGEKTGNLDRSGKAYTHWNTDYFAYGVGDDPLYMSIPFYIGTHDNGAYGIFLDNTHKSVFNFGASTNRFVYFSAEDGDLDYYFIYQSDIKGIIQSYTELTGRMQLPPKWALGFQQCRYSYYPDSEVYAVAQGFRDKKMPADVIYLDIHHMEAYKVFTFDGVKFSDPKSMIAALKAKGFKVVVIMDPGIKTEKGYLPYDEGLEKDLFVKYPDGKTYEAQVWPGWCAFPDFTLEETRKWWAEKMAFYTEAGVDGFWTDMNEPASWGQFTPNLIEFAFEGRTTSHREARNVYGMQMARSAQEGSLFQNPAKRPFVLTRSGFAGIQRYAAAWTGDNVASEEHMMAGIRLVNSLGMSGVSFAGYDVGGFAGEATQSLFARWMSIGAFSPFYRAHSMINSNDAEPWAFGEETEEISRNYMKLRYRLLPTIYSKFYLSSKTGLPLAESLAVQFAQDEKIFHSAFQNQYLFCDSFLVAPVESNKEITKVLLPQGDWYYLYSDKQHLGEQTIYQDCPLNYLPVYVQGGSVFAMQSQIEHSGEAHDGVLELHVYHGSSGSNYFHYEDEGEGYAYQNGEYFSRTISFDPGKGKLTFSSAEGTFPSEFKRLRVFFHGFKSTSVELSGEQHSLQKKNYAFLSRLTEFDPLPEHHHPYFEIKQLPYLELDHLSDSFEITGLT